MSYALIYLLRYPNGGLCLCLLLLLIVFLSTAFLSISFFHVISNFVLLVHLVSDSFFSFSLLFSHILTLPGPTLLQLLVPGPRFLSVELGLIMVIWGLGTWGKERTHRWSVTTGE